MKDQRAMIAHHEAGHAVTAYRLEFILGPVGIAESDGLSTSEGEWADGSRRHGRAMTPSSSTHQDIRR